MLKNHLDGVRRFVKHPITNGVAEGLNSKLMSIKGRAGGFRHAQHFTTAIYFHCGWTSTHADPGRGKGGRVFGPAFALVFWRRVDTASAMAGR